MGKFLFKILSSIYFFIKKYYNTKMRLRHKIGSELEIKNSKHCINLIKTNNQFEKLDLNLIFKNANPNYIEFGTGKGQFICKLAKLNPQINFIGVDRYATVLSKAIKNLNETFETAESIENLRFLLFDVKDIKEILNSKTIDKIYLNFSDPWPKKRHINRRLTSYNFLQIYDYLLKNNGSIEFKTDNIDLFNFSLNEIKNYNSFKIEQWTFDLHNDIIMNKDNIMTEYEEKFSSYGNKICKLIATKEVNYG